MRNDQRLTRTGSYCNFERSIHGIRQTHQYKKERNQDQFCSDLFSLLNLGFVRNLSQNHHRPKVHDSREDPRQKKWQIEACKSPSAIMFLVHKAPNWIRLGFCKDASGESNEKWDQPGKEMKEDEEPPFLILECRIGKFGKNFFAFH